jgi:hypothetical protein
VDIKLNRNIFIHSIEVLGVLLDEKCLDGRGFSLNEKKPTACVGRINGTDFSSLR